MSGLLYTWMKRTNTVDRTLFGGPSQPEPDDERGGIRAADRMARESDAVINPNQYENDNVSPFERPTQKTRG